MTIRSKFNGRCRACGGAILAGTEIEWTRDGGARHRTFEECQAARTTRATGPAPVTANAAPIAGFIRAARDRGLKFPKARFLAPDGRSELLLSLATDASRNPGAVYVKLQGEYIGLIATTGEVRGRLADRRDILATLATVAENPAAAAKAYGALNACCSFCNLPLTDAGSVAVGYGPVCADHWGLPHAPAGTPALRTVQPEEVAAGRTLTQTELATARLNDKGRRRLTELVDELFAQKFEEAV
jgi:hypothetical protein